MKILITGGHVTPALTFIDYVQNNAPQDEIIFVGRKYYYTSTEKTLEYQEIANRKIQFINLETGRLIRDFSVNFFTNIWGTFKGFFRAIRIINETKPDVILSFGSYMAVPIAFAAVLRRIPVYTHEQTIHPGLANKLIGIVAQKVFISFPESAAFFDQRKIMAVGYLIREQVKNIIDKPFDISNQKKVIYITGGSLGAHRLNRLIEAILPQLLKNYVVIHQIGNIEEYQDFERLKQLKQTLSPDLKKHYYPVAHFSSSEIGYIYSVADLVIARAGANTYAEVLLLRKPTLFVPLPESAYNEQQQHAALFQQKRLGKVFDQSRSSDQLLIMINQMMNHLDDYRQNFNKLTDPTANASSIIYQTIQQKI